MIVREPSISLNRNYEDIEGLKERRRHSKEGRNKTGEMATERRLTPVILNDSCKLDDEKHYLWTICGQQEER